MDSLGSFLIIILILVVSYFVAKDQKKKTRCNENSGTCRDGDGIYQNKGRGGENDNVEVLLSRIVWLTGHYDKTFIYHTAFTTSGFLTLGIFLLFLSFGILSGAPLILSIFFLSFILIFSMQALYDFHTARYSQYYTKYNAVKIMEKLKLKNIETPLPTYEIIPHRTSIRTFLDDKHSATCHN